MQLTRTRTRMRKADSADNPFTSGQSQIAKETAGAIKVTSGDRGKVVGRVGRVSLPIADLVSLTSYEIGVGVAR